MVETYCLSFKNIENLKKKRRNTVSSNKGNVRGQNTTIKQSRTMKKTAEKEQYT